MPMKLSQVLCVLKKDSKTPIDLGPFILAVGLTSIGKGLVIRKQNQGISHNSKIL